MRGEVSEDVVVGAPAKEVWSAYRGAELARLVSELLGDVIGKAEIVEGDGGVGSVVKLTLPPGTPGMGYMKELFVKMDDEVRVKETEVVEGGLRAVGFDRCKIRLEILEKDAESTIIRNTIEYEVEDSKAELASVVSTEPLKLIAQAVGDYLCKKKSNP